MPLNKIMHKLELYCSTSADLYMCIKYCIWYHSNLYICAQMCYPCSRKLSKFDWLAKIQSSQSTEHKSSGALCKTATVETG